MGLAGCGGEGEGFPEFPGRGSGEMNILDGGSVHGNRG